VPNLPTNTRKSYTIYKGDSVQDSKEYVVRVQSGVAYTYGIGEVVVPGVAYFAKGTYDLSLEEVNAKFKQLGKVTLR
jgi:hypothetical protein